MFLKPKNTKKKSKYGKKLNQFFLLQNKQPRPIPKKAAINIILEKKDKEIISADKYRIIESSKNKIKKLIKKI